MELLRDSYLSARNEPLNQVIIFNEDHLRRLMREYVEYHNGDRCHLLLERDSTYYRCLRCPCVHGRLPTGLREITFVLNERNWRRIFVESDIWIPDANIFLEYIYDRKHSKRLITDAIQDKVQLITPSLCWTK